MKSRKTGSIAAVLAAAIGATVLVCSRSSAVETVYPVERAAQVFRNHVWSRVVGVFRGSAAAAENLRLRRENDALKILRGTVERLEVENGRLRRVLDYSARKQEAWIPAGVLSEGGGAAGFGDRIRVDKGSLAGIRAGAVVIVPEGLVGRVASVTPHTAEVTLVTDPTLKVACEVATGDSRKLSGVLSGGSEDGLILRHLTGTGKVLPRARVFTSGRGGVFPRGIEVGTLQNMTNGVRGVVGDVLPQVDYSTLEDVFIRREK